MAKSHAVREAIRLYGDQAGALSIEDRDRTLALFDETTRDIPDRPRGSVDRELAEVRAARRAGGRGARAGSR